MSPKFETFIIGMIGSITAGFIMMAIQQANARAAEERAAEGFTLTSGVVSPPTQYIPEVYKLV